MAKQVLKKRLLKDIVIPAGTVFDEAPMRIEHFESGHYHCTVGLTNDTSGDFTYHIDPLDSDIDEWFEDIK